MFIYNCIQLNKMTINQIINDNELKMTDDVK